MHPNEDSGQPGTRVVTVDLVVAALIFLLGALVAWDSYRLGASWGSDGPQSGYFPFYIGLIICICSAVIFVQSLLRMGTDRSVFVAPGQLRQVMVILLPSTAYVLGVELIGIYVSSAIFIALFMRVAGRYTWFRSVAVGLGVSISSFVMFEIWFKIPLPKGPLETLIGY
jgi:putative tricarboxylic transport membrane protein